MIDILSHYEPITLDEMSGIRLMNRTDTKFVTTKPMLRQLLLLAQDDYRVQEIKGERIAPYYTVYFDTPDYAMYLRHETGHTNRQKLRIRSYVNSGLNFLEVKTKNNHGRTRKKRITMHDFDPKCPQHNIVFRPEECDFHLYDEFLTANLRYEPTLLTEKVENHFNRITLVNKLKTERLTIDFDLEFDNIGNGKHKDMGNIVIVELKRDGLQPSPILNHLMELRIKPMGFSKYIIGPALTDSTLHCNRIKPRLRKIEKMMAE